MAGDGLLQPVVLIALSILIVNDHILKQAWPGPVTGKLSDFAGLLMFPFLLQAAWELMASALGFFRRHSTRVLLSCIGITALAFTLLQLSDGFADVYRQAFGFAQSPASWLGHEPAPDASVTQDPSDLMALSSLIACWFTGRRRSKSLSKGPV